MKFGPKTKLEKRHIRTLKEFEGDVLLGNCNVIVIFPIYDQFGVMQKTDFGRIVYITYIFINLNLFSYQN